MARVLLGGGLVPPQSQVNGTQESYGVGSGDGRFDVNMVIVLAALLCALVFALCLNSIVRSALRCARRFAQETPDQAALRLANTGLKKRVLRRIPVVMYSSGEGAANFPANECPICLGEFEDGDKVKVLPKCNHGFHVSCIDAWLVSHSSCPNCRHSLLDRPVGDGSGSRDRVAVVVEEPSSTGTSTS